MTEDQKRQIDEICDKFSCPRDFECCRSEFRNLCDAKDFGIERFLRCLDEDPKNCQFSLLSLQNTYFCQCPLRIHIAKILKK